MTATLTVELALAWPVLAAGVGRPLLASAGTADRVRVSPGQVFRHAIRMRARGVILAHNHLRPTGPSPADLAVTRRLVAAGHLLGVPLLAHLVIEPDVVHDLVGDSAWSAVST